MSIWRSWCSGNTGTCGVLITGSIPVDRPIFVDKLYSLKLNFRVSWQLMAEETKKPKVLLIEDDIFMIELLAKDLEAAGMEVVIAKSGVEGVKRFEEGKPDIVLLDLLLPDQNGFETLRKIRRHPDGPKTRVMILSNIAEGPDMDEAKRLGVVDYLVKANFTLSEVVKKIQEALAH